MMEVDQSMDENTTEVDNQIEHSTSTPEQVTESGTPSEYTELWNEFKCVFCSQDIKQITNPKLLSCLHTACESCLTSEANNDSTASSSAKVINKNSKYIKNKNQKTKFHPTGQHAGITKIATGGPKQLVCPSCSQEINIEEAVDHLFLMEYAQTNEGLPEESSYPCTSCEEGSEGVAFCQDCQEWLCESCVNAHHRVRVTKDHVVRPKEEMDGETAMRNQKYLLCPVHSNEQLKVYCETCDKLTCRDCQLSDHKAHKYQFLSKACEEEKDHITELLNKIKEKQGHMEDASNSLNKRHEEIIERESVVTQEIKLFAVKFITDINKRGRTLLEDLNKVCTDKKKLLNVKTQELKTITERLKHCQKFAEAAISLGSETALVYSKKPIMNQLRRILRHKCDVPNPNHMVDIQFIYETNFLTQYISNLGQILVDQQPLPGSSANANAMLPMPQPIPQAPVPTNQPIRQVPQMQVNQQRIITPQVQQIGQQQLGPYGQPQVTSSTDLARNVQPQMRQVINNQINYGRANHVQRTPVPNQQANFQMQSNQTYTPRQMVHQQNPQANMRQRPQVQQQQQQQQQQQIQQQQQQPPPYNNTNQLPMPLRQNKNISVTALPSPSGPSPSKQRVIAPRPNLNVNAMNNQGQRSNQVSNQQRSPQLIVLDGENNQKTPNMSNTARLTHFPSNLAATLSANPSLQIQPASTNYQRGGRR